MAQAQRHNAVRDGTGSKAGPGRLKQRHAEKPPTRIKLILTAEKMFAARGIEGISLREIATAAGQGNTNAVAYHFESKLGLASAIFAYRIAEMEEPRRQLLGEAEERQLLGDARALLEVLCLPQINIVDDNGRHSYASFMANYQYHQMPESYSVDLIHQWPVLDRIFGLLLQLIKHIPEEVARLRIRTCNLMFQDLLARMDDPPLVAAQPFATLMNDRLETMTSALIAPYKPGQEGGHTESLLRSLKLRHLPR